VVFQVQCYSACANYILPAAQKGFVKRGAVVGWHGGAYQGVWSVDLNETTYRRLEKDRIGALSQVKDRP